MLHPSNTESHPFLLPRWASWRAQGLQTDLTTLFIHPKLLTARFLPACGDPGGGQIQGGGDASEGSIQKQRERRDSQQQTDSKHLPR